MALKIDTLLVQVVQPDGTVITSAPLQTATFSTGSQGLKAYLAPFNIPGVEPTLSGNTILTIKGTKPANGDERAAKVQAERAEANAIMKEAKRKVDALKNRRATTK